ncbi:hypothetical protein [Nannocystis punicea]|uniref:Tryptophan synthase alpha chain n=1 Tax=Nannocystis punicea TaxID=2995304 RepID=A0ABY7GVW3_9BACT|nr:hypothetical protein [Nannocystis poenicansa]WAS91098.1 hypothetical protein O0S08_33340 [Nannocystis poenicansa]
MSTVSRGRLCRLLVALMCACGPEPAGPGSDGGTEDASATASGGSGSTATTSGASGSTAAPTTGEPELPCVDPQPIFQRGGEVPSGFVRCANGIVHRLEVVACAVEGFGDCMSGNDECHSDVECDDAPHGTCHQVSFIGCVCNFGCGSDADCAAGEICACPGVLGKNHSQCIPAGCLDSSGCEAGLCALAAGGSTQCGALAVAEVACIDASSPCLVHEDCRHLPQNQDCGSCWPQDGAWSCGTLEGCGVNC